ncbi:MAG: hypothetical protein R2737_15040 [Candidatus Nanopelagicales bacterium]
MRSWRVLVGAVAGSLVVVGMVAVAPPAAAIDTYVLTPAVSADPVVGTPATYVLTTPTTGPAGIPAGTYCLAAQLGQTGTTATPVALSGQLAANLQVTFNAAGSYTLVLFTVTAGTTTCPGTTLLGTSPLTTLAVTAMAPTTYQLAVDPVTVTTTIGGKTQFALTLSSTGGGSVNGVPVLVSSTGRNTFSNQAAGTTNGAGKLNYSFQDNAPALSVPLTDTVTFSVQGVSAPPVTATITYRPAASAKVTVVSPANGSAISSGGLFGVSATTSGITPGTIAYLTLGGSAKAQSTVQANGNIRFDNTSIGGGKWIPAEAGQYAVRVCGGACGPTQATSNPFALTIIPFQIIPPASVKSGKASFTVATGNWAVGTTIYLTRNGNAVKKAQVVTKGKQLVVTAKAVSGKYQVRVNSNQGYVYGNQAGVVTLK